MSLTRILSLPCWQGAPKAEPMRGGLSNEIWKVTDDAGAHVVRFGADYPVHHVSRADELMAARAAHAAGFAPAVEYAAEGVMVTEFIGARTWGPEDLAADPERVAALLRDFHSRMPAQVSGPGRIFWPFHVLRDYARTLAGTEILARDFPDHAALTAEFEAAQVPLPIVFGHHDLLPANFLESDRLWLIDFEYAAFGTAMFDLAGVASNSGMSPEAGLRLLTAYFGAPPDPPLRRAFAAMQCASLLREAMWAFVSERHLAAPGVDYAAYGQETLARFRSALAGYRQQGYAP